MSLECRDVKMARYNLIVSIIRSNLQGCASTHLYSDKKKKKQKKNEQLSVVVNIIDSHG